MNLEPMSSEVIAEMIRFPIAALNIPPARGIFAILEKLISRLGHLVGDEAPPRFLDHPAALDVDQVAGHDP